MPVIAYKNRLLGYNISFAFNTTYTKDFKLKNKSSTEYLTTEKDIINKVIKNFNKKEFDMYMTNYNVELLALSKYFLDKIPNIFSISYETKEAAEAIATKIISKVSKKLEKAKNNWYTNNAFNYYD